jgi:hypothetical protein
MRGAMSAFQRIADDPHTFDLASIVYRESFHDHYRQARLRLGCQRAVRLACAHPYHTQLSGLNL